MKILFINIQTGEQLSYEKFVLLAFDKAKERWELCGNSDWDKLDDKSKALAYSIQSQDMINLEGWRMIHDAY